MTLKNKTVCVVTGYKGGNYGTKLQSTALCKFFEKKGYQTYILNSFKSYAFYLLHPYVLYNRLMCKLNRKKTVQFFDPSVYEIGQQRQEMLRKYEEKVYHPLTIDTLRSWNAFKKNNPIMVVGSDIIWQPAFGPPGYYFLDFTFHSGLRKFSYATSIGANELPKEYHKYYRRYLDDFTGVSVREQKAADMLNEIVDTTVIQRIDPTLLHRPDFWDTFSNQAVVPAELKQGQFIFCYFVMDDQRYWDYVKIIAQETGFKVAILPMHHIDEEQPYVVLNNGTPCEFLWLIKNSAFICTDSFHACAFSLNYRKEFYLLRRKRKDEDAKYNDFFARYGLEDRVVENETMFTRKPDIDYKTAHKRLEEDRIKAYQFIDEMLGE